MKIFRNRTVIGVLCILLALIICFGVTPLFSRSASEKTEIVRVTKDIKEGDEITAEMVQTVEVGAYNLPQNLMTDKKEVVGKYATADLAAGDYILSSKLSAVPAAENAYLYNLDGTKQAISVTIKSFAVGLSGKLESGDTVTMGAAHPTCIPCSKAAEKRSPPPREDCAHLLNPGEVRDGPPRRTHSIGDLIQRKNGGIVAEFGFLNRSGSHRQTGLPQRESMRSSIPYTFQPTSPQCFFADCFRIAQRNPAARTMASTGSTDLLPQVILASAHPAASNISRALLLSSIW